MLDNIGLFKGMTGKMNWLSQRQTIISQNVANADTPGYMPRDLRKVDFGVVMKESAGRPSMNPAVTDGAHINKEGGKAARSEEQRTVYEVAPDGGNAVIIEEQLFKSQETATDYSLMTSLYRKNVNMMKIAIGKA